MSAGQVKIPTGVGTLTGGMCCINSVAHNLTGGAVRIGNEVKHFSFGPTKHKVRIVRSYDGNATSYCRMIVNGTTTNDTKEVEFDAGTTIEWFVMSIGAMAPQAKIILNGTTVQAGPGAYKMPLNSDLLVQFARGGSGKKLYYEIYITEVPDTIKEVWLINEDPGDARYFPSMAASLYSYDGFYVAGLGGDGSILAYMNDEDMIPVYNANDSGKWVSQGYRLIGLLDSYLNGTDKPEWFIDNAVPYFYKSDTYVLNESMRTADLINAHVAFRSNDTDFTKLSVVDA